MNVLGNIGVEDQKSIDSLVSKLIAKKVVPARIKITGGQLVGLGDWVSSAHKNGCGVMLPVYSDEERWDARCALFARYDDRTLSPEVRRYVAGKLGISEEEFNVHEIVLKKAKDTYGKILCLANMLNGENNGTHDFSDGMRQEARKQLLAWYHDAGVHRQLRTYAGEQLGYSSLRMWLGMHPGSTMAVLGVSAATASIATVHYAKEIHELYTSLSQLLK